jgi:hypothetical protein
MDLTITIQCFSCGWRQTIEDAELSYLSAHVPYRIEGECRKCFDEEHLHVVQIIGRNVNLTKLAEEAQPTVDFLFEDIQLDAEPFW